MQTQSEEFNPENDIEIALVAAQAGKLQINELMEILLKNKVAILLDGPTPKSGQWDSNLTPLVLSSTSGGRVLAIFSSPDRATPISKQSKTHNYLLQTDFSWVLKGIAPEVGLVINPGWPVGLEMPPYGVIELKKKVAN